MGFSKYSVFWKVGSGFETPTSLRAPLYEKTVQKDITLGEGVQNMIASSSVWGAVPVILWRDILLKCGVCFIWTVLSLEVCFYGNFIRHFKLCLSRSILAKAEILFPKSVRCSLGYKFTIASLSLSCILREKRTWEKEARGEAPGWYRLTELQEGRAWFLMLKLSMYKCPFIICSV